MNFFVLLGLTVDSFISFIIALYEQFYKESIQDVSCHWLQHKAI